MSISESFCLSKKSLNSLRAIPILLEATVLVVGGALGGQLGLGTVVFALAVGPALQFFRARVWAGYPELPGSVYRRAGPTN